MTQSTPPSNAPISQPPPTYPRGSLVEVALEDRQGREPKIKFGAVVSSNTINTGDRIVIVVPVRPLRGRAVRSYEVLIPKGTLGLSEDHAAVPAQIRSIDVAKRVTKLVGSLDTNIMTQIGFGLFAALGGLP